MRGGILRRIFFTGPTSSTTWLFGGRSRMKILEDASSFPLCLFFLCETNFFQRISCQTSSAKRKIDGKSCHEIWYSSSRRMRQNPTADISTTLVVSRMNDCCCSRFLVFVVTGIRCLSKNFFLSLLSNPDWNWFGGKERFLFLLKKRKLGSGFHFPFPPLLSRPLLNSR